MFKHKTPVWDWDRLGRFDRENPVHDEWGLLLDRLLVIDFDSQHAHDAVFSAMSDHPDVMLALSLAPMQKTSKGYHYLFLRSAYADTNRIFDGARQCDLDVDIKTVCSSGSRGVLAVEPSPGKTWVRRPWSEGVKLQEVPQVLLDFVTTKSQNKKSTKSSNVFATRTPPASVPLFQGTSISSKCSNQLELDPEVLRVLDRLSPQRWLSYESWHKLAVALKNSFGEMYRDAWIARSRISPRFNLQEAERKWSTALSSDFNSPSLTFGTIRRWCAEDQAVPTTTSTSIVSSATSESKTYDECPDMSIVSQLQKSKKLSSFPDFADYISYFDLATLYNGRLPVTFGPHQAPKLNCGVGHVLGKMDPGILGLLCPGCVKVKFPRWHSQLTSESSTPLVALGLCVASLFDAATRDGYDVSAVLHDGVVLKVVPDFKVLRNWKAHIICTANFELDLEPETLSGDSTFLDPIEPDIYDNSWTAGHRYLSYDFLIREPFIVKWLKDPFIRKYDNMDVFPPPMVCHSSTYNLWSGFDVSKYNPQDRVVDPESPGVLALLDHARILLDADVYNPCSKYFLDWLAHIFQFPSEKSGVAIILRGPEGAGKNRLTDLVGLMLGPDKFIETPSPEHVLFGQFNTLRRGRFLIAVNEVPSKGNHGYADKLKDMITSRTFNCEEKGRSPVPMNCFSRMIFTTNNDNVIKLDADSRRFVVVEVSGDLKGDTAYFTRLSKLIADPHVRFEFYTHLMARDLSRVSLEHDKPITSYHRREIEANLCKEYEFLRDEVILPRLSNAESYTVSAKVLYMEFESWLFSNSGSTRFSYKTNSTKFGLELAKLTSGVNAMDGITKKRGSNAIHYTFEPTVFADSMVKKMWLDELPE
ncbi:hypothetical protein CEUSTIGMA_g13422.t1 [Chlamydomonas eustigma]|uniref:Uncharacterized protein n=1 Tax=Chlamydomonas eustigma TaxID=1157962 RepID=A0A250XSJ5_9CHLO|nr:hypothetical protein CEUSTIGMA_g13422.t1 [Chlamydomonas eustigma]|eukprot:GAX86006.1 hypothetical protein CEUSTIGMA_g13422.t1 [Chlamydomonas eustigma]